MDQKHRRAVARPRVADVEPHPGHLNELRRCRRPAALQRAAGLIGIVEIPACTKQGGE